MSSGVNLILSLAGSLCATSSLAAGEALRTSDEPFRQRVTSRMLLSLALLGAAVAGGALEWLRPSEGSPSGSGLGLLLLAAGAAATLWAYAGGPRRRGGESFGERITSRGKLALGLLAGAQVLDLSGGRLAAAVQQFQGSAAGSISILAVLGLVLVALGTGAAAATFRAGSPLLPGAGPPLQRLSQLAKGTCVLLGLALAVVALASYLSPESGMLTSLGLLALGITTGLFALLFAARPGTADAPGPWGIPSRGWVSLAFLALAGGVLGAQEARLLGPPGGMTAPGAGNAGATRREPPGPVGDEPSVWSMRKYETTPAVVDVSQWSHRPDSPGVLQGAGPGTDPARAQKERPQRPAEDNTPSPSTVDVSKWHHPAQ